MNEHKESSVHLLTQALLGDWRRMLGPILGVGAAGALIGFAYLGVLRLLERFLGPEYSGPWIHLLVLAGVGVVIGLIKHFIGNPGEMELLVDNIHVMGGNDDLRGTVQSLVPMSLLCIAAGGAAGPEAPLVQTTGTFASWLAKHRQMTVADTRVLTITGMAAGFTVLFGAPFGAAIFALEILHRRGLEYYEALLPAVIGSLCGYAVYVLAGGAGLTPVWVFPPATGMRGVDLLWALAAGVAGAAVAVIFTYLTVGLRRLFGQIPMSPRAVVGGGVLGLLALWSPYALTFGETQLGGLVAARAVASLFLVAAAAKLLGTSITISTGWRGGFIIPLFFIGAALGRFWHLALPQTNEVLLMAALMAAINTGVTKTPLGSTLVVTKMTGLPLLPTTLAAAVVALLLTSEAGLIHTQQRRRDVLNSEAGALPEPVLPGH